jgi:hypothetical protein
VANQGIAIFVIFFGVSLLDAFAGGHWLRAAFWIAIGVLFWALARARSGHRGKRIATR